MTNIEFKYPDGKVFSLPFFEIGGYHYVRIEADDILTQLPVVANTKGFNKNPPEWITWHWTAAPYDVPFNHYQVNVGEDYILVNLYATDYGYFSHTWQRNGKNLGISYMAMGGTPVKGMYPTDIRKVPKMIETGNKVLAALVNYWKLKWTQVTDHAAWAVKDGYPGQRWDTQLTLASGKTLYQTNISEAMKIVDSFYKNKTVDDAAKKYQVNDSNKTKNIEKAGDVSVSDTPFNDVNKTMWFADSVQKVLDLKIMSGKKTLDKGLIFDPDTPITRAEFAVAIDKLLKFLGK